MLKRIAKQKITKSSSSRSSTEGDKLNLTRLRKDYGEVVPKRVVFKVVKHIRGR